MALNMTLSDMGLAFIATREGFSATVYKDGAGNPTVGYGHLLAGGESYPDGISEQQAIRLLSGDVANTEAVVGTQVKVPLTQQQFDALVSFAFNVGSGAFERSTLLKYINAGRFDLTADEFLHWDKVSQDGVLITSAGLAARRAAERNLFLYGKYA